MTDQRPRPSLVKTAKEEMQLKIPPSIIRSSSAPLNEKKKEAQSEAPAAVASLEHAKPLPLIPSRSLNNLPPTNTAPRISQDFSPEEDNDDYEENDELALNPTGQQSLRDNKSQAGKKGLPRTKGMTYAQLDLALQGVAIPLQTSDSGRDSSASNSTPSPILHSSTGWHLSSNPPKAALSIDTGGFQVNPKTDRPITIIEEEDDSLSPKTKTV